MPSALSNPPSGVLLTREHALLVECALSDAEEIGHEAIARLYGPEMAKTALDVLSGKRNVRHEPRPTE